MSMNPMLDWQGFDQEERGRRREGLRRLARLLAVLLIALLPLTVVIAMSKCRRHSPRQSPSPRPIVRIVRPVRILQRRDLDMKDIALACIIGITLCGVVRLLVQRKRS